MQGLVPACGAWRGVGGTRGGRRGFGHGWFALSSLDCVLHTDESSEVKEVFTRCASSSPKEQGSAHWFHVLSKGRARPCSPVVCVFDADQPCDGEVVVLLADGQLDLTQVHGAVRLVGDRPRVHPTQL